MKSSIAKTTLHKTKNDLAQETRVAMVELLNRQLANGLDLQLASKHAHWNVKGPDFVQLHELFDKVWSTIAASNDELAERIAQLGGTANGTLQSVAGTSAQSAYPRTIDRGREHIEALSTALASHGAALRAAIEQADDAEDAVTTDLLTRVAGELDKQLWFVEAHQQADS